MDFPAQWLRDAWDAVEGHPPVAATHALLFAFVFAFVEVLISVVFGPGSDALLIGGLIAALATGLSLAWPFVSARRGPAPTLPPEGMGLEGGGTGPPPDFRWSGRFLRPVAGAAAVFGILVALLALTLSIPGGSSSAPGYLWMVVAVLAAFLVVAAATTLRRRSASVDDMSVRLEGRVRTDFDVRWNEVAQVELTTPPNAAWVPGGPTAGATPIFVVFRGRDGSRLGVVVSDMEFGRSAGAEFRRSVRGHAARHAVPVVAVDFGAISRGKFRRPRAAVHPR